MCLTSSPRTNAKFVNALEQAKKRFAAGGPISYD